jgi:hypothetical protein
MFYTKWLSDKPANKSACASVGGGNVAECAEGLARKMAGATLFRNNVECGECHEIAPSGDDGAPWKMARVHINRDWQPGATFAHNKHNAMNCTACHDKTNSKTSADISMPDIEKCRECHVGEHAAQVKIKTNCDNCHRFHAGKKQLTKN